MNDVLDSLSGLKEQRLEEYHRLADWVLAGEQVAADEIELACLKASRDPGDFAQLIRKRQERAKERERFDTLPEVRRELAGIDAEIAANNERLVAAQAAHTQEAWRLAPFRDQLIAQLTELNGIEPRLVKDCSDESLNGRARSLAIYLESNRREQSDAVRNLHIQQAVLRQHSDEKLEKLWYDRNANSLPLPTEVPDSDPCAEFKRRVLRAHAVVDQLDDQAATYRQEIDEIRDKQYQW
ncbi:hypothetical protein [Lacipirellula sp.]|uniref:hypothetical protein n=1 Tax=Lacipirellula sp. TaxID=2691419 RepID=UPI003D116D94